MLGIIIDRTIISIQNYALNCDFNILVVYFQFPQHSYVATLCSSSGPSGLLPAGAQWEGHWSSRVPCCVSWALLHLYKSTPQTAATKTSWSLLARTSRTTSLSSTTLRWAQDPHHGTRGVKRLHFELRPYVTPCGSGGVERYTPCSRVGKWRHACSRIDNECEHHASFNSTMQRNLQNVITNKHGL